MRPRGGARRPHRWCAISPKTLAQSWCVRNARKASEVFRALTYAHSHSSDHHVHILVPHTAQGGTSVLSPIRDRASLLRVKCTLLPNTAPSPHAGFYESSSLRSSDSLQPAYQSLGSAELFLRGHILQALPIPVIGEVCLISQQACRQESNLSQTLPSAEFSREGFRNVCLHKVHCFLQCQTAGSK